MAGDLATGCVQSSSKGTPEDKEIGSHVPAAPAVDHPEASVSFVGLLVEALVLRHIVLSVDQAHFDGCSNRVRDRFVGAVALKRIDR